MKPSTLYRLTSSTINILYTAFTVALVSSLIIWIFQIEALNDRVFVFTVLLVLWLASSLAAYLDKKFELLARLLSWRKDRDLRQLMKKGFGRKTSEIDDTGKRFEYESKSVIPSIWLMLRGYKFFGPELGPWLKDNDTGQRILLTREEDAYLTALFDRLILGDHSLSDELINKTSDCVSCAIIASRDGDTSRLLEFDNWDNSSWDAWIAKHASSIVQ